MIPSPTIFLGKRGGGVVIFCPSAFYTPVSGFQAVLVFQVIIEERGVEQKRIIARHTLQPAGRYYFPFLFSLARHFLLSLLSRCLCSAGRLYPSAFSFPSFAPSPGSSENSRWGLVRGVHDREENSWNKKRT